MKLVKRKTRKAIKKSIAKVIDKHGPEIAGHLAAALIAGLAALAATEPDQSKKSLKKLRKAVTKIPGVAGALTLLSQEDGETGDGEPEKKRDAA